MAEKKRIYHTDVVRPQSLRLERATPKPEKNADQPAPRTVKEQFFSPELISRLTERIKKL